MTNAGRRPRASSGRSVWAAAVSLGVALGACSGLDRPMAPADEAAPAKPDQSLQSTDGGLLGTGLLDTLLRCTPLPAVHAAKLIGPAGGTLTVGPHSLVLPPGALSYAITITADAPSDTVNSVRFQPQGLQFAAGHAAQLTMSYANCPLPGRLLPKRIAYTTDLLEILNLLLSVDNVLLQRVSAQIAHFSRYAIAW